jgi:hypothetical protein
LPCSINPLLEVCAHISTVLGPPLM